MRAPRPLAAVALSLALAACGAGPYDTFASGRDAGCRSGKYSCFVETVYDPATDLSWERAFHGEAAFETARAACDARAPAHAWRLPTTDELLTLVAGTVSPKLDLGAFPATPAQPFWATSPFSATEVTTIDFATGLAAPFEVPAAAHAFRCVRPGR